MYAYCSNNPIIYVDADGKWINIVVGAVVGGIIGGVMSGITTYVQTGSVDWGSVVINTVVGAANGAIAATGLGLWVQAGISAGISGVGNALEQIHTNEGCDNFNVGDMIGTSLIGAATSILGTGAGKLVGKGFEDSGKELMKKGTERLLTGFVRKMVGQSHSAFYRQGTKYVMQARTFINTFRGITSVVGSGIGVGTSVGYNIMKSNLLGW